MNAELKIKQYKQEGDMVQEYHPLHNLLNSKNNIVDFNVSSEELDIDLNNPLNIECQPSYDGTVNLIINDDKNPPRIINTRFSKLENDRYKVVNRNQLEQTNLYREGHVDQQTRLFRNVNKIPKIDLESINNSGTLKGGNYTFYIKYADGDSNKTDIVAESGQISIFKGFLEKINSISGTLLDELTDKSVTLRISNLDTSFSHFYILFTRETSMTDGTRIPYQGMIKQPFIIKHNIESITINGYEEIEDIDAEEVNLQYNLITAAKTQTQAQNMLFFGNIQSSDVRVKELQNASYYINVSLKQRSESIGWISPKDYTQKDGTDLSQTEYYNPTNIYYNLGYWPEEMYRLGVVYIMKDDSLSPVFNLRGHAFTGLNDVNYNITNFPFYKDKDKGEVNYLERNAFLKNTDVLDNTYGVFKNPKVDVIDYTTETVKPLYYEISINEEIIEYLLKEGVKGYFFVRQKRIPTILCQGLSVGIDYASYVPMLYNNSNLKSGEKGVYFTESFLSNSGTLTTQFDPRIVTANDKQCSGLLSIDASIIKTLGATFDGSEFILQPEHATDGILCQDKRHFWINYSKDNDGDSKRLVNTSVVYINSDTPMKYVNGYAFATKCGNAVDVSQFSMFEYRNTSENYYRLIRGNYTPYLGVGTSLKNNMIYTIKIPNYSDAQLRDYFTIRGNDNSPFFAISDRKELGTTALIEDVYRGDCYTNTVTVRLNRNFVDPDVPINETIIDPNTWKDHFSGYTKTGNDPNAEGKNGKDVKKEKGYAGMNRSDVNTVPLGMWVTYKCLSNYNLGLRAEDTNNVDEYALMGNPRSFYPYSEMSTDVSHKMEESFVVNEGFSSTVGRKRYIKAPDVPYVMDMFENRIMFSNVQTDGDFKNAYRIFQGLDYQDIDRQYGAIVKFLTLDSNIFCVFEHGLGIIPINEKALISTQSGQSIHMYGAGVIQNQISLISSDFGSIWPESVIQTPLGIYGVDTYAKKIWRYTKQGLETISDMRVQSFINKFIDLKENDKTPIIGLRNVKTHYNNFKGDIMFTFYNEENGTTWNLCYNERYGKWITRYSWTPLYSENINNIFYSLDRERVKVLSYIYNNKHCTSGIKTSENQWEIKTEDDCFETTLTLENYRELNPNYKITRIETSEFGNECIINKEELINNLFEIVTDEEKGTLLKSKPYKVFLENITNQTIQYCPVWFVLTVAALNETRVLTEEKIGIVLDNSLLSEDNSDIYEKLIDESLRNGFYIHGKAGIFDEIDYNNDTFEDQILPTKWYDKQEPFELEFVVNDQMGAHKIFNNLVIISNNVQPKELEFTIEGDVFNFNKAGIYREKTFGKDIWDPKFNKPIKVKDPLTDTYQTIQSTQNFEHCEIEWDTTLNSYSLVNKQQCKNITDPEYGRRLGNIQYREDAWYITIDPIQYTEKYKLNNTEESEESALKSARLRDKFIKIRVKYTGEDLVIITALKTLYTLSYA